MDRQDNDRNKRMIRKKVDWGDGHVDGRDYEAGKEAVADGQIDIKMPRQTDKQIERWLVQRTDRKLTD